MNNLYIKLHHERNFCEAKVTNLQLSKYLLLLLASGLIS
jgi:hypothetical protein